MVAFGNMFYSYLSFLPFSLLYSLPLFIPFFLSSFPPSFLLSLLKFFSGKYHVNVPFAYFSNLYFSEKSKSAWNQVPELLIELNILSNPGPSSMANWWCEFMCAA